MGCKLPKLGHERAENCAVPRASGTDSPAWMSKTGGSAKDQRKKTMDLDTLAASADIMSIPQQKNL